MGEFILLFPSGIRVTVPTTPQMMLAHVLEIACKKRKLNPDNFGLQRSGQRSEITDLGVTVHFSNIPNRAVLEVVETTRKQTPCKVAIQPPTGDRLVKDFPVNTTLWQILRKCDEENTNLQLTTKYEQPSPGSTDREDSSESATKQSRAGDRVFMIPVCRYLRTEVNTLDALKTTSLKDLGIFGGAAKISVRHVMSNIAEGAVDLSDGPTTSLVPTDTTTSTSVTTPISSTTSSEEMDVAPDQMTAVVEPTPISNEQQTLQQTPQQTPTSTDMTHIDITTHDITLPNTTTTTTAATTNTTNTTTNNPNTTTTTTTTSTAAAAATTNPEAWRAQLTSDMRAHAQQTIIDAIFSAKSDEEISARANEFRARVFKVEKKVYYASTSANDYLIRINTKISNIRMQQAKEKAERPPQPVIEVTYFWRQQMPHAQRATLRQHLLDVVLKLKSESEKKMRQDEFFNRVAAVENKIFETSTTRDEYFTRLGEKVISIEKKQLEEAAVLPTNAAKPIEQPQPQLAKMTMKLAESEPSYVVPDRELRVLRLGMQSIEVEDVDDSFFAVSAKEAKSIMNHYKKVSGPSDAPLLTAYSRKRLQQEKEAKLKQTKIRVLFVDQLALEFVCHPKEPVANIYAYVENLLADSSKEFHLFTTPPMKILDDHSETLVSAGLVPKANIRIGVKEGYDVPALKPHHIESSISQVVDVESNDAANVNSTNTDSAAKCKGGQGQGRKLGDSSTPSVAPVNPLAKKSTSASSSASSNDFTKKGGLQFLRLGRK